MPSLLRKLIIIAAVDGLILQPHGNGTRHNGNDPCIQIDYKTNRISPLSGADLSTKTQKEKIEGLEVYGLVGLLSIASSSFLVSITQRQQVAQIYGKPVYAITNVALIPISSQKDADRAISQARINLAQGENGLGETASEDVTDTETETDAGTEVDRGSEAGPEAGGEVGSVPASPPKYTTSPSPSGSGIAEDVIGKKLPFGRFAANWLSRKTLGLSGFGTVEQERADIPLSDMKAVAGKELMDDVDVDDEILGKGVEDGSQAGASPSPSGEDGKEKAKDQTVVELMPKLLRYSKLLFAGQNFFFAYDYDISRQVTGQAPGIDPRNHLPLHRMVDPLYFWNRHLMTPFIEADAHAFILPLVQGFVGQREFTVALPDKPEAKSSEECAGEHILGEKTEPRVVETDVKKRNFLLTLISRRSLKRPGLRYLRRGVDDDGNTANTVETEQILSSPDWDPSHNVYSYLQLRGSIPLYFSQSPYAFKPVPVLHHNTETNKFAFERHFRELSHRYGKIQAVSLIDRQAGELKVGEQYEKYAQMLNEDGGIDGTPLGMEWFDFHNECRGMKFENVSKLVDRLKGTLEEFGDSVSQDGRFLKTQKGIVRTNCMDCLDRTGVVQCAFGQWALESELKKEGVDIDLGGQSATQWFNTLWADNGDAISKQYSSTAALKGDYTRTRKRDYRGALNDLGLTLSRYFNNIVSDYFSQACIDYLLGNVTTQVFQEFATEMQSADPGISVQKLRQNAIDTSCRIVISDNTEEFLGGWTMLSPRQPNTLRTLPFEESVLLLTDAAVYSCRFDWNTDKVLSFERIDLRSITHISYGTYITSILTEPQMDSKSNVGLVISYRDGGTNALRVNTRSLHSQVNPAALDSSNKEWGIYSWFNSSKRENTRFIAFKALPLSNSVTQTRSSPRAMSELDLVRAISEDVERAMVSGEGRHAESSSIVDKADIISLTEAKRRTGYLEYLVYDIKKLVWA